jgi:hypothetical protein
VELSKTVPARKVKFEASSCKLDFMEMNQRFSGIRAKSRYPMDKCEWCKHKFVDGEMMALAISKNGNKVLCQPCGQELLKSDK